MRVKGAAFPAVVALLALPEPSAGVLLVVEVEEAETVEGAVVRQQGDMME